MTDDLNTLDDSKHTDDTDAERTGPAYGRLASEFPGWDPYVYGKPKPSQEPKAQAKSKRIMVVSPFGAPSDTSTQGNNQAHGQQSHSGQSANTDYTSHNVNTPQFYDRDGNPVASPFERFEFDPDDPKKNPAYGRWDFYAIIAFIGSFFTQTTLLALFLAIMSLNRTKILHMKGRTLAIIAIILCVLQIILFAYIVATGMTELEFLNMVTAWIRAHIGA